MAITIDATVGGASANSFVTLAEFAAHMQGRLNSTAFDEASADSKNRALAEATRELSARTWKGYRVTHTQALAWPRQWAHDPDSPTQDYYGVDVIPGRVKRATFELALEFLKAGSADVASLPTNNDVVRKKVDVIETEYTRPHERPRGLARFPAVLREIRPLLAGSRHTSRVLKG